MYGLLQPLETTGAKSSVICLISEIPWPVSFPGRAWIARQPHTSLQISEVSAYLIGATWWCWTHAPVSKVGLVEHILCVGCGHKQELVPANPASVDGRRFKRRHHSFDLEWLFRRLRNHYHFAVIIAEDPCIYDVNLSDPDEFRIFLWGKSRLTTKCLNPGSFQLPVTLHQHAAKFVVEVAKDGLTHGIFGIHLLIFAIHIFVITCQGQV